MEHLIVLVQVPLAEVLCLHVYEDHHGKQHYLEAEHWSPCQCRCLHLPTNVYIQQGFQFNVLVCIAQTICVTENMC